MEDVILFFGELFAAVPTKFTLGLFIVIIVLVLVFGRG